MSIPTVVEAGVDIMEVEVVLPKELLLDQMNTIMEVEVEVEVQIMSPEQAPQVRRAYAVEMDK